MANEDEQKSVMAQPSSDLFSSVGALLGFNMGGPMGALLGSAGGTLLSGGSFEDALNSGIGSLFNAGTMGQAGLAANLLGYAGDPSGMSNQNAGANLLAAFTGGGGSTPTAAGVPSGTNTNTATSPRTMGSGQYGGVTGGLANILDAAGITKNGKMNDPVLMSMILNQIYKPKDSMTPLQKRQYSTAETLPDYRGVAASNSYMHGGMIHGPGGIKDYMGGGMIHGPGTGKSDSIPAQIYQNGGPVQQARLSDGEFVMTADAVKGAGGGSRALGAANMYKMMNNLEKNHGSGRRVA